MKKFLRLPLFSFSGRMPGEAAPASLSPASKERDSRVGRARSVMSECLFVRGDAAVSDALEHIRLRAAGMENLHRLYVTDDRGGLVGALALKSLLLARPDQRLADVMDKGPAACAVADDLATVADALRRHGLADIPVLDEGGALVGVVDRADLPPALLKGETSYFGTSLWGHFKSRVLWIVALAVMGLASGLIIRSYEDALSHMILLAMYMPMVADTGGNTGSQSATVIIRALALGEVRFADLFRVLFRELRVSLLVGAVLALLAWAKVLFLSGAAEAPGGLPLYRVGAVIGLALGLQVVTSTLIGAFLPLAAVRLKVDPAVAASPMLTTIVDITGLLIYFGMAGALLGV